MICVDALAFLLTFAALVLFCNDLFVPAAASVAPRASGDAVTLTNAAGLGSASGWCFEVGDMRSGKDTGGLWRLRLSSVG